MNLLQLIELVKQHHPHMGEEEIRHLLNRAADDLCMKSELISTQFEMVDILTADTLNTTANQRFYKLPEGLFKISEVFLNGVRIPRTLTKPIINDYESEEDEI